MSENPESTTESMSVASVAPDAEHRDRRLHRMLVWVGIVAGVVFIVAVVFFAGFALGRTSGGYHGWHRGYHSQSGPVRENCPMMRNGSMMGPGDMGPGMMRPGESPSASPRPAPGQR